MSRIFKSPIAKRRWNNFKSNRRAFWSLWIFSVIFIICLFAELVANDKPLLVSYKGDLYAPAFKFYSEADFGGEFESEAEYPAPEVQCLIRSGGLESCLDDPEGIYADAADGIVDGQKIDKGWILNPPIPYSFNTINYDVATAPSAPDSKHWLGTDDQTRDVVARIIYGFRISTIFGLLVVFMSSCIGIFAGAVMGYFGGWVDLIFQRLVEIWDSTPSLYIIIIFSAIFTMNFWILMFLITLFSWTGLVGLIRAEFLRARNFEYVRAARALGVSDMKIMFRHLLPNAMVATLTFLPFLVTGAIGTLTSLDFLGFGLPASYPSLGELALQAKNNLHAPWLGFSAFFTFAIMLSLLVFIFEGVRDAFDPRKTFK
ncbi:peptide ABC transporter permease [Amylibacter kogurei]|uniref:Peptide ABC transporter permease n=1 Tax=Paramylibacter kogurei TaxID=1889778 RepID=A0A2G5KBP1_9RHOB|nr:peptide ABC transporter permease [Amylibacter kogurei]